MSFFAFLTGYSSSQDSLDRRLVYSLSTRKVPTGGQLRHLKKFLNPREYLILKICSTVLVLGVIYFGFIFFKNNLEYYPSFGGSYVEGVVGYPKSINPLYSVGRDVDADLSRLIYSSLFKYDINGVIVPDLVSEMIISEDGKEYTLKIKNNAVWHNGERLTVEDVVYTVETIQNQAFHSPLRASLSLAVVEKVDDETIKFKLSEAYSPFLDILTFGIMPKRLWETVSADSVLLSDLNLKPVGSGPYKFKSLTRTTSGDLKDYVLEVNPGYYGQVPYIEELSFRFYPNIEEAVKALNSKQVSGLSYLPFGWKDELLTQNSLKFLELRQARLVSIFFNQAKNTALADKETRVALALALDKAELIKNALGEANLVVDGPILPSNWAYNSAITVYGYNQDGAREKLSSGPLNISLTVVDSGSNVVLAEEVKKYWEAAGAVVSLRIISGEQAADVVKSRDFEALIYGQFIGGDPDLYSFWHSSQAGSAGLNISDYKNDEVDKLLIDGRTVVSEEKRKEIYYKFQEIISADLPAIFLYSPAYTYVQGGKLQGFFSRAIISPSDRFAGISGWYLKTGTRFFDRSEEQDNN